MQIGKIRIVLLLATAALAAGPGSLVNSRAWAENAMALRPKNLLRQTLPAAPPAMDPLPAGSKPRFGVSGGAFPVFIEMADPPVAQRYVEIKQQAASRGAGRAEAESAAGAAGQARLASIEQAQNGLLRSITSPEIGAQVLYRCQRTLNGIAARVDPARIGAIRAMPGVASVRRLVPKTPHTATSVPFIGAPRVWDSVHGPGATGRGIAIGFVDTGIDYLHTDFGGSGLEADYAANNPAIVGDVAFPSAKVAGGYDFVGDDYDADSPDPARYTPHPDPDPMDLRGHGTHVAGIAAGFGVNGDGTAYAGPYPPLSFDSFMIGPGVAPEARIYALKVFGNTGSTIVDPLAVEWAVDPNGDGDCSDHLDVINLSLGSPFGSSEDPSAIAVENAASVGVIVVCSAGNEGDAYYVTGAPGVATGVIGVGASADQALPAPAVETLAGFTSRGPRRAGAFPVLKPDIAAPGLSIASAWAGTGTGLTWMSGTSMAAPHVSGAMALLRQLHPDWTVEELKALIMNTATHDLTASPERCGPARGGAGRVDVANAGAAMVVAYCGDAPGAVGVSFGVVDAVQQAVQTMNVRLVNKGATDARFNYAFDGLTDVPGAAFALPAGGSILVPAFGAANLPIQLEALADEMLHTHDPTIQEINSGFTRHWISEESGYVTFSPDDAGMPTSRVPIYAAPRPASTLQAAVRALDFSSSPTASTVIPMAGRGFDTTSLSPAPAGVFSIVEAFELQASSPNEASSAGFVNRADLKYVGAATDYKAQAALGNGVADSWLYFGIATHGEWDTPATVLFQVFIDADNDGADDFVLENGDRLDLYGLSSSDIPVSVLWDLRGGLGSIQTDLNGLNPANVDSRVFNTNVMALPVNAGALGLTDGHAAFRYRVETRCQDANNFLDLVDSTGPLRYDAQAPGFDFTLGYVGAPWWYDFPGYGVPANFDQTAYAANGSRGVLLLHLHNVANLRAEAVPVLVGPLGQGPPNLDAVWTNGDGSIQLNWSNPHDPPREFLGLAWDFYASQWAPRGPAGSVWFSFPPTVSAGPMQLLYSGGYHAWISSLYDDGQWFPANAPWTGILYGGRPHTPLDVQAQDLGGRQVDLRWRPDVYGTASCQMCAYKVGEGFVFTDGPDGASLWHFVWYPTPAFLAGQAQFTVPSAGQYWFFLGGVGWLPPYPPGAITSTFVSVAP